MIKYKLYCILSLLIYLINSSDILAQKKNDFEGSITYKIEYLTKNGEVISDRKQRTLGDTSITYIKKGNYAQEYPHSRVNKVIYISAKNEYYTMFNRYDTIFVSNYLIPSDPIKGFAKIDTSVVVLGYKCKGYKVTALESSLLFFYTDSLYLNPIYFKNHKESGYDHYAEDTKSIYLKLIISYEKFDISFTAVKISKEKIDDKVFNIPLRPLKRKIASKKIIREGKPIINPNNGTIIEGNFKSGQE